MISCEKKETDKLPYFFNETNFGAHGSKERIFINATFSECGEWGGHKEEMELYAKKDKNFYLDYRKYKVNCDDIGKLYGKPEFQKLDFEKTILIDSTKKEAIIKYVSDLTEAKIKEFHIGHSGQIFSINTSDSTFVIKVYSENKENIEIYNNLQKKLGLELTKNETE